MTEFNVHIDNLKYLASRRHTNFHEPWAAQRELVDALFIYLDAPWWRFLKRIKMIMKLAAAVELHKECCGLSLDD